MKFYKYQSLGNNFIILDYYGKNPQEITPDLVKKLCDRNFGIGADGVLLLSSGPKACVFNADGTDGQICLNGIRCLAKHLFVNHGFPNNFSIEMGSKTILCSVTKNLEITTYIDPAIYVETKIIDGYTSHFLEAPNPHLVIFEETDLKTLEKIGGSVKEVNIEFVWPKEKNVYNTLVYERGCGITLACGSGAVAIMTALLKLEKITMEKIVTLKMPGGYLKCKINTQGKVTLAAQSHLVFTGVYLEQTQNNCNMLT